MNSRSFFVKNPHAGYENPMEIRGNEICVSENWLYMVIPLYPNSWRGLVRKTWKNGD